MTLSIDQLIAQLHEIGRTRGFGYQSRTNVEEVRFDSKDSEVHLVRADEKEIEDLEDEVEDLKDTISSLREEIEDLYDQVEELGG